MQAFLTLFYGVILLFAANTTKTAYAQASTESFETDMQHKILYYLNKYRTEHGLGKLVLNTEISKEAKQHSIDMAQHRLPFGHDKFNERIDRLYKKLHANGGAENIAYNYKTAEAVSTGWIHSPGHRHNIRGHYNLTGIGIAFDEKGKIYYTQLFLHTL